MGAGNNVRGRASESIGEKLSRRAGAPPFKGETLVDLGRSLNCPSPVLLARACSNVRDRTIQARVRGMVPQCAACFASFLFEGEAAYQSG